MNRTLHCPYCGSTDLEPCADILDAPDEKVLATHRCRKCDQPFRDTPPIPGFTGSEVIV